jgi:transposase
MSGIKRQHSGSFKAKVALEAIKEASTIAEISSQHSVHSTQVRKWKQEALAILTAGFSGKHERKHADQTE